MRDYYNHRHGHRPREIDLATLNRMVTATFVALDNEGYFSEVFGKDCVDAGLIGGLAGEDPGAFIDRHTYLPDMWPLQRKFREGMDEVTLFTIIEFLHDYVSQPNTKETHFHSWSGCGYHYDKWEKRPGQQRWRDELNPNSGTMATVSN